MPTTFDLADVKIPSLPVAAVKILELVQDPDVDVQVLGRTIELDPALSARVVRLANSSLFGLTRAISSVRQALVILGLRTVKLAALSFTLVDSLGKGAKAKPMSGCWRQILTNAMACRMLGGFFEIDPEEGFLGGLMQDIGLLVCAESLGQDYLDLFEASMSDAGSRTFDEMEKERFGLTHTQVGAELIEQWRLPPRLATAIREHADLDLSASYRDGRKDLSVLLATADAVAGFLLRPTPSNLERFNVVAESFGELSSEIDKFVQRLELQVGEVAELLELELPANRTVEEILEKARELSQDLRVESRDQLPLRVRQELARAKREKTPLSVVLLRLTSVSQLAKNGLVEAAERLQQAVSRILQSVTRECDALFRLNLSTFCILAVKADAEGVERLQQRLIPALQKAWVEADSEKVYARFVFGVATLAAGSTSDVQVEAFLLKANDNLAEAQAKGEIVVATVF
jgi:HD-like signal output (HDOD) protein